MKQPDNLAPVPRIGLNAEDAAKAIGVSKRQLFALKDAGEIPFVEVGAQTFLFDPHDLVAWLNRKKTTKEGPTNG
jgi:excisionase family DNA binding protein